MRQGPSGHPHHSPPLQHVGLPADCDLSAPGGSQGPAAGPADGFKDPSDPAAKAAVPVERLPTDDPSYPNAVKVSQGSKIPAVAGKIAHSLRARDWPTLLVAGNSSIHAAVKCCITAGRFLHPDGLAVTFEPRFRDADHSRALLALGVLPRAPAALRLAPPGAALGGAGGAGAAGVPGGPPYGPPAAPGAPSPFEIKASAHSRHAKVGAVLSARLTEEPSRVIVVLALGEQAVANAVMAAAHASHYLGVQHGLRLAVQAHTAAVVKEGDQLTGVQLWVTLQADGPEVP